ncbi:ADP-ribosylglycohydrolase family protein [Paenibacillus sp. 8b26]|uniref:ADP-ribosylglycohydrolase family protein n=1 Tax=Paenibacillus sp. 8b26 TaxID=3424133 RepID=UPI003D645DC6
MSNIKDGILGLCIGDALGVPVEFSSREARREQPLTDMMGYGTHHQPPGTWSDDASLTLCLLDSLTACRGIDTEDIARRFVQWYHAECWTPHGKVFDIGIATRKALDRISRDGINPELAGGDDEYSNGNGSLMRILPLAWCGSAHDSVDLIQAVTQVSSITHRHPISIIACVFYVHMAMLLIRGKALDESYRETILYVQSQFQGDPELRHFERILSGKIPQLAEREIYSSGYVVHTLEASLWSLLMTDGYADAVLRAIHLGEDTDTTGAVTGGLAGIYYGLGEIPQHWLTSLARVEDIVRLCKQFEHSLAK